MAAADETSQPEIKFMTPYPIANDPPPSQPIPDVQFPEKSPAERATRRFSLAGKNAIGPPLLPMCVVLPADIYEVKSNGGCSRSWPRMCPSTAGARRVEISDL